MKFEQQPSKLCLFPEITGSRACFAADTPFGDFGVSSCCQGAAKLVKIPLQAMIKLNNVDSGQPLTPTQQGIHEALKRKGVATRYADSDYLRSGEGEGINIFGPNIRILALINDRETEK